ncbi:unnamed protein product [Citrullus colocynthis]|uniref:Uncharacterized protein n=1 Tax=Citrullus colocynthis TaxID=252529 RepID=A0ABP0YWZ5_9ROSI
MCKSSGIICSYCQNVLQFTPPIHFRYIQLNFVIRIFNNGRFVKSLLWIAPMHGDKMLEVEGLGLRRCLEAPD